MLWSFEGTTCSENNYKLNWKELCHLFYSLGYVCYSTCWWLWQMCLFFVDCIKVINMELVNKFYSLHPQSISHLRPLKVLCEYEYNFEDVLVARTQWGVALKKTDLGTWSVYQIHPLRFAFSNNKFSIYQPKFQSSSSARPSMIVILLR